MSDEPKRPGCLTLSTAYTWHHNDRMEVVEYIKHIENENSNLRESARILKEIAEEGA